MTPRRAVLVVGSPRLEKSTSLVLGGRLMSRLESRGLAVESHFVHRAFASPDKAEALFAAVGRADIVVFAFPLYVDHLPAPVIWACDEIAARRASGTEGERPLLALITQCGFPETHQNQPASDIMRRFADRAGFEWAGGLILGMGGAVSGRPLPDKPKGMVRNVLLGFDRAAADLAEGRPIDAGTIALVGRRLMPSWLYFFMANFGMRHELRKFARKSGRKLDPYARPYAAS
jgi:hypothetical protein